METVMFDLTKTQEAAENRLRKNGFTVLKDDLRTGFMARVLVAMDGSGSTKEWWHNGTMQGAIQAVLPTALAVDDDGEMPVAVFNDGENFAIISQPMTRENHASYVSDHILDDSNVRMFCGTDYSPVLKALLAKEGFLVKKGADLFSRFWLGVPRIEMVAKPHDCPSLIYFFTDGACSPPDKQATSDLFRQLEDAACRVYILLLGVGAADFSFLRDLGERFSNVGFACVQDLATAVNGKPEEVTALLLPDELLTWLKGK